MEIGTKMSPCKYLLAISQPSRKRLMLAVMAKNFGLIHDQQQARKTIQGRGSVFTFWRSARRVHFALYRYLVLFAPITAALTVHLNGRAWTLHEIGIYFQVPLRIKELNNLSIAFTHSRISLASEKMVDSESPSLILMLDFWGTGTKLWDVTVTEKYASVRWVFDRCDCSSSSLWFSGLLKDSFCLLWKTGHQR